VSDFAALSPMPDIVEILLEV